MAKEPRKRIAELINPREYFAEVKFKPYHILAQLEDRVCNKELSVPSELIYEIDGAKFKLKTIHFHDPNEVWLMEYQVQ
jgi:carbonic anhydrase